MDWKKFRNSFFVSDFLSLCADDIKGVTGTSFACVSGKNFRDSKGNIIENPTKGHPNGSMRCGYMTDRKPINSRLYEAKGIPVLKMATFLKSDAHWGTGNDVKVFLSRVNINLPFIFWAFPEEGTPADLFRVKGGTARDLRNRAADFFAQTPENVTRKRINPDWCEWFFGWPSGWTRTEN